jgi:subtilisin family serine protease
MTRTWIAVAALLSSLPLAGQGTQRYVVATRANIPTARIRVLADASDAHRVRRFVNVDGFAADLTSEEAAELRATSGIVSVNRAVPRQAMGDIPADPELELAQSWGVQAIHAPDVWPFTRGENVNIAILDTGIDLTHPDLVDAIAGGVNVLDPSKSPQDDNKHGTHVAGIAAARGDGRGVIGVAPAAKLWAVKVLDSQGNGSDESVTAGIDWVLEQAKSGGLWIINLSLGANSPSDVEQRAVERALSAGIAIVASAGNRTAWVRYPAKYPGVIAVGAVDAEGKRTDFSSTGLGISVMAPGDEIYSSLPQGSVRTADVRPPHTIVPGFGLILSPLGSVHGMLVPSALGRPGDFPSNVTGNIALIERGEIPFREKARNAKEAGAAALVIYNNVLAQGSENWTMQPPENDPSWEGFVFPLAVGMQRQEGLALLDHLAVPVDVGFRDDAYGLLNGTSMSSPHVAGLVALLRALAPQTNVAQLKYILEHTAKDLEDPGVDTTTGWGSVDALAAARYAAPARFGLPEPVPEPTRRRRAAQ